MSTDIVIGQTLDLDTGQDALDWGPNFVFNPVQKTQPLPDKGQLHLVDPTAGLHDRSSRGGDDEEETGRHEHDYPQCDHHCMDQNSSQHTTQNSHQLTHQLQQSQGQLCNSSKINDVSKQAADMIIFDNKPHQSQDQSKLVTQQIGVHCGQHFQT